MTSRLSPSLLSLPLTTLALAGCLLLVAGCDSPGLGRKGGAKAPASWIAPGAVGQTETTGAALPLDAQNGPNGPMVKTQGLSVSDAISQACGIAPRANGKTSPSFEFDSAALAEEDRKLLGDVARCLTDGALKGKNVALVGRADARGEPEYNMTLGESRADGVRRYMVDLGVGRDRMKATSRGEMDAVGKDEAGWAQDRRVDIELAK